MTGPLAPLFAQVREALDADYDGFCAWCQCSIHEQPHASECEGRRALAALSSIKRHVQDMERKLETSAAEEAAVTVAADAPDDGDVGPQARDSASLAAAEDVSRAALPAREKEEE